jgi:hypothetical protein
MLTHDEAFGVMCRMLGLTEMTDIIRMPDATIRDKCGQGEEAYQLANLLISLKKQTQRDAIAALSGSGSGAAGGGAGGGSGGQVDMQDAHNRMGGGQPPAYGGYGGMPARALLQTMQALR